MSLNIQIIRESFNAVKPHAQDVVDHFYSELFKNYPGVKPLFQKVDMKRQKSALIGSLVHIVDSLDNIDHLQDYLKKMGARHIRYGTLEEHYPAVGKTLIETLAYFFEDQWTAEVNAQWTMAVDFIAGAMIAGAQQERSQSSNNVVSLVPSPQPPAEPSLKEIAQEAAKNILKKALEEELNESFTQLAREKAREVLKKALEDEAKDLLKHHVSKKAA